MVSQHSLFGVIKSALWSDIFTSLGITCRVSKHADQITPGRPLTERASLTLIYSSSAELDRWRACVAAWQSAYPCSRGHSGNHTPPRTNQHSAWRAAINNRAIIPRGVTQREPRKQTRGATRTLKQICDPSEKLAFLKKKQVHWRAFMDKSEELKLLNHFTTLHLMDLISWNNAIMIFDSPWWFMFMGEVLFPYF